MKTFSLIPLFIFLFSFSQPCFGGGQDSLLSIELSGNVLIPESKDTRFYKLELLSDNVLLEAGIVVDSESFLLRVKKNSLYTIRITKEGYPPLVISINTYMSELGNIKYNFDGTYFVDLHGFNFFLALQQHP